MGLREWVPHAMLRDSALLLSTLLAFLQCATLVENAKLYD